MAKFPKKLQQKLQERKENNALRSLPFEENLVDFSSNDYLGFANNETIYANTFQLSLKKNISQNGATGSRLLSGNHNLYAELERQLTKFHKTESALVFNSGYDANIGFFSAVPQRGDVVFYDEYIHASIRDGIKMGNAKSYKFKHNDLGDLKSKCQAERSRNPNETEIYIVTESVFSMDGDSPDLKKFADFCASEGFHFIVDEAHAIGVLGKNGKGIVQDLGLEKQILARIITFGKALGCHGAAILGGEQLKHYLVNFARSFIYTTGLPPHSVATILSSYAYLEIPDVEDQGKYLRDNISLFRSKIQSLEIAKYFVPSDSAIHCCMISGNDKVKSVSKKLNDKGFDVKAILSPTVPEGEERLRFCLHSFNSPDEIGLVLQLLKSYL
ncbi:aminotransferase class I/II-fold pyridoxal phosphate-dependent enzyme [Maribacter sp. 2308TA10-17]|uniref:aminotransferase class I/II-fold pyridoxal phosphate-dependent enzyme n=1 Tax=Maribacter sp. 2308TA10-17 TaxID=3386276 RepID=UPI0039BC7292